MHLYHFKAFFKKYLTDDKGATAIEYGLIAVGIAIVIAAVVFALGGNLSDVFTDASAILATAAIP